MPLNFFKQSLLHFDRLLILSERLSYGLVLALENAQEQLADQVGFCSGINFLRADPDRL